jgi:DNA-binding transcriptional LysR family regulator
VTLRQLEVFVAIARALSFRRAAEALHTSQPALSQHVRELEAELGARLLDRLGRGVAVTDAGRLLLEHAQRVFATLDSAREGLAELRGLARGSLELGASTTPGIYVLPRVIGAFRRRHPGVSVSLRIANSRVIGERVRANELALGVVGGHGLAPGEQCLAAGLGDELVLVVAPGHPWARRRQLSPARLAEAPLLVREEGSATRAVTERALDRAGVAWRVAMELDHTEAIKQAVMAGLGAAFVSIHAVRGELAGGRLHALRLAGLPIRRHFHVIHNEARALPAAARAFLEVLAEAAPAGAAPGGLRAARPARRDPAARSRARAARGGGAGRRG